MSKQSKPQRQPLNNQPTLSRETQGLIKVLERSLAENRKIYEQILQIDRHYQHKLYQPVKSEGIDEMFVKPLVMRQIDQLMEEKELLVKKKEMLDFRVNSERGQKEHEVAVNQGNHYAFLRNVWTKFNQKSLNSTEKIDNLNKIINMTKLNIRKLTQNDQKTIQKEVTLLKAKDNHNYLQLQVYERSRQQIQTLQMRNEQLEAMCLKLSQQVQLKNQKIEELQEQLGRVQQRIKDSIQTLNLTGEKLIHLRKSKSALESEVRKLQSAQAANQFMVITGLNQSLKITIEAQGAKHCPFDTTQRSLSEIIQYLKSRDLNPEFQLPFLNLTETISTNQTTVTDRFHAKESKFIPMRSQRACLLDKSKTTTSRAHNQLGNEQLDGTRNQIRRFSRKKQFPLTCERFRKEDQASKNTEDAIEATKNQGRQ